MKLIQILGNILLWVGALCLGISISEAIDDHFMKATAFALLANLATVSGTLCWIYIAHRLRTTLENLTSLTQPFDSHEQ